MWGRDTGGGGDEDEDNGETDRDQGRVLSITRDTSVQGGSKRLAANGGAASLCCGVGNGLAEEFGAE